MNQRTQNDKRGGDNIAAASIHKKGIAMTEKRKKLYEAYRKLGMTEEQIEEIKKFDDEMIKGNRGYRKHTVRFCELPRKNGKRIRRGHL